MDDYISKPIKVDDLAAADREVDRHTSRAGRLSRSGVIPTIRELAKSTRHVPSGDRMMTATGSFTATTTITLQTFSTRTTDRSIGSISRSPTVTGVPGRRLAHFLARHAAPRLE